MSQLLETIQISNGQPQNLPYHQRRFDEARCAFWPNAPKTLLSDIIKVPSIASEGVWRCRVLYSSKVDEIQYLPYRFKKINNLKLVEIDFEYNKKWSNRISINNAFSKKANADDVLFIKNGKVTDTSYANIVFNQKGALFTPAIPLLAGTKRQKLLEENKI